MDITQEKTKTASFMTKHDFLFKLILRINTRQNQVFAHAEIT